MEIYRIDNRVMAFTESGALTWTTGGDPTPPPFRAIVSLGESNAGGNGLVSALPSELSAETSRVQILRFSTGLFENLNLGTNNNEDHNEADASLHSWEAGLIPYMDANLSAQTEPFYLVQCAQGGSKVADWANGQTYWDAAESRINQAKAAFLTLGIAPVWEIWFTLGINDFRSNPRPTPSEYKAACITLLGEVRTMIGNGTATRIRTPEFMPNIKSDHPEHTAAHEELATDVTNCQLIETGDLTVAGDNIHWTSAAQVLLGQRMAAI